MLLNISNFGAHVLPGKMFGLSPVMSSYFLTGLFSLCEFNFISWNKNACIDLLVLAYACQVSCMPVCVYECMPVYNLTVLDVLRLQKSHPTIYH